MLCCWGVLVCVFCVCLSGFVCFECAWCLSLRLYDCVAVLCAVVVLGAIVFAFVCLGWFACNALVVAFVVVCLCWCVSILMFVLAGVVFACVCLGWFDLSVLVIAFCGCMFVLLCFVCLFWVCLKVCLFGWVGLL